MQGSGSGGRSSQIRKNPDLEGQKNVRYGSYRAGKLEKRFGFYISDWE
jgi:hypothetical protein